MRQLLLVSFALAATALLAGCTYERTGPPQQHLSDWGAQAPSKNAVSVCSAYGCQKITRAGFGRDPHRQGKQNFEQIYRNCSQIEPFVQCADNIRSALL